MWRSRGVPGQRWLFVLFLANGFLGSAAKAILRGGGKLTARSVPRQPLGSAGARPVEATAGFPSSRWGSAFGIQHFSCCRGAFECQGAGCRLQGVSVKLSQIAAESKGTSSWAKPPHFGTDILVPCSGVSDSWMRASPQQFLNRKACHHRGRFAKQFHLQSLLGSAAAKPGTVGARSAKQQSRAAAGSRTEQPRIAVLVYRDIDNLFHQTGSVIATYDYLTQVMGEPLSTSGMQLVFIDGMRVESTTEPLWSPGMFDLAPLTAQQAAQKFGSDDQGFVSFDTVLVPVSSRAHWWWNVWQPDYTDRTAFFRAYANHVTSRLLPPAQAHEPIRFSDLVVTILMRQGKTRRLLNPEELERAVQDAMPSGVRVERVTFGKGGMVPWKEQFAQIRRSRVLVSTHGAGLTWNILLPPGAGVVEMMASTTFSTGHGSHNEYFDNECGWLGRPYKRWVNMDPTREPFGQTAFNRQLYADTAAVAKMVREIVDGQK